ncbi:carboxymuconolactone decarboxylase family protein [Spirillospora sp. NPDC052269]
MSTTTNETATETANETATGRTTEEDGVQSRLPNLLHFFPELAKLSGVARKEVWNGPVPQSTINVMLLRAAQVVGSTYHAISLTAGLRKAGESEKRITAVATWKDAPYFTDAERIALELVEAVLTPNPSGERVPDELFARAHALYGDEALWTLTMAIGHFSMFIPVALIAKPVPGRAIGKGYTS